MTGQVNPTGELAAISTSVVSDALDRLGIAGQCFGVKSLDRRFRLAGPAYTMRCLPVGVEGGSVGDYIDDVDPNSVIVIDNGGRLDATIWGDILTAVAHRREIAGTVIDGVCRDIRRAWDLGYPIFARDHTMRTGKDRVALDQKNIPVSIGGALVQPGDILLGDANGLVVIPLKYVPEVVDIAHEIEAKEAKILESVMSGMRLDEARKRYGYFKLQSRIIEK